MGVAPFVEVAKLTVQTMHVVFIRRLVDITNPLIFDIRRISSCRATPWVTSHYECVSIDIIAFGDVICCTKSSEDIITMIARSGFRFKECAVIVFTIRRCTSLVVAHSEAYTCIGVPFMVVIIEVNPGIATTLSVSTDFRTTEVSSATVLLEHDIDDTGCTFRTEFS